VQGEAAGQFGDSQSAAHAASPSHAGAGRLILNADDWGRDRNTTQSILDCAVHGSLSSASAMVFMEDSDRAATIARELRIDTGLHLNLTSRFSAPHCPRKLLELQGEVATCLRRHRFSPALFHPSLVKSFEYLVSAQIEEYGRLYGTFPARIDGHHHMHLSTNVLVGRLLPPDTIVRRSFSFSRGEKSWGNRLYRRTVDRMLARRHRVTDFFFSITPLESHRLERIVNVARTRAVEIETHPINPEEYGFLMSGKLISLLAGVPVAHGFAL
jgi:chitin disaccharide deacetylase